MMKYLLYGLLGVVCLIISGASFLYFAAPTDAVKRQAIALIYERTGRKLTVTGASLSFFPRLAIRLKDVALSHPRGIGGDEERFLKLASVDLAVPLLPLLARRIEVDRLVLTRPVVVLKVGRDGRRSWDFTASKSPAAPGAPGDGRVSGGTARSAGGADPLADFIREKTRGVAVNEGGREADPLAALAGLTLGDVRIVDGTVRYMDERSGREETITKVNLAVKLADIDAPMSASGSLVWKQRPVDISARVESLRGLTRKVATKFSTRVAAVNSKLSLEGTARLGGDVVVEGPVSAEIASVRELARWLDAKLPEGKGFGGLALTGLLQAGPKAAALKQAKLKFDSTSSRGNIAVRFNAPRPQMQASLVVDGIDLNDYLAASAARASSPPAGKGARTGGKAVGATPGGASSSKGGGIEGLLRTTIGASGPAGGGTSPDASRSGGAAVTSGAWSKAPIDLAGLKAIDARLELQVGKLRFQDLKIGRSRLSVGLKSGQLAVTLHKMELYEGSGTAAIFVDARAPTAQISAKGTLRDIAGLPLLTDAAKFKSLAGRGTLTFDVRTKGRSQSDFVQALGGSGRFVFADGAIIGVNIPGMVRALQSGKLSGWRGGPTEKTDFSSLSASFTISGGMVTNKDLAMVAPLVRLSGSGKVDAVRRRLSYLTRPKLVASLEGQGGGSDLSGLEIPVRVHGPWDNPQFSPDLAAMVSNPGARVKAVRGLAGKLNKTKLKKMLKGKGGLKKTLKKLKSKSLAESLEGLF